MTNPNGTAVPTSPVYPPGRYGRRREPRRARPWIAVVLAVVVAVAASAVAWRLYRQYGDPPFAADVVAETDRTAASVTVRIRMRGRDESRPAVCTVRARGFDGAVVGTADVPVPAGKRVEQTYTLPTTAVSALVDVTGCRAA